MTSITFNQMPRTARTSAPRLRLTPRGRAVFGTLAALPVVAIALFLGLGAPGAQASGSPTTGTTTFEYVSVAPGQSLWQLAEQLAPQADPSEVVADILALNNLSSGVVQPGQKLAVPAEYRN